MQHARRRVDLRRGVRVKGAGIRRYNRPERDFEMIHRSFMRLSTKQLSMRGRTVALFVLSHDFGYVLTQDSIARRLELAVRTVADALKDLEAAGLLVRIEERNVRGHRTGTAMHVSDVPFTDQERADLLESLPAKSADAESAGADSAGHKKSNSKQESKEEEEQPSGGSDAGAPSALESNPSPEEDMPRAATVNQPGLFEAPEKPKKPRKEPKLPEGAAAVVAAFVESYTQSHAGARPLRSDIGRVAVAAKLMLRNGEATEDELVLCGKKMGRGQYANLYQELKFLRPSTGLGAVPRSAAHDDPAWDQVHTSIKLTEEELATPMEAWL